MGEGQNVPALTGGTFHSQNCNFPEESFILISFCYSAYSQTLQMNFLSRKEAKKKVLRTTCKVVFAFWTSFPSVGCLGIQWNVGGGAQHSVREPWPRLAKRSVGGREVAEDWVGGLQPQGQEDFPHFSDLTDWGQLEQMTSTDLLPWFASSPGRYMNMCLGLGSYINSFYT